MIPLRFCAKLVISQNSLSLKFVLLEMARDYLQDVEGVDVIGGIFSPVHEKYKKVECVVSPNEYRRNMSELALSSSDWIRLSEWEMQQSEWTQTHLVLRHHQVIAENCAL